jgi:hypothetical protein
MKPGSDREVVDAAGIIRRLRHDPAALEAVVVLVELLARRRQRPRGRRRVARIVEGVTVTR